MTDNKMCRGWCSHVINEHKEPNAHSSDCPAWGSQQSLHRGAIWVVLSRIRKGTANLHKNLSKRSASETPGLIKKAGTETKRKCKFHEWVEPDEWKHSWVLALVLPHENALNWELKCMSPLKLPQEPQCQKLITTLLPLQTLPSYKPAADWGRDAPTVCTT
jgi:hypothetical protein